MLNDLGRLSERNDGQDQVAGGVINDFFRLRAKARIAFQMPNQGVAIKNVLMRHSSRCPGGATLQS